MLKDQIEYSLTFDDVLLLPRHCRLLHSEVSVISRITKTLECDILFLGAVTVKVPEHQTAFYVA